MMNDDDCGPGYNSNFVAKEPGHSPQSHGGGGEPGYNPRFVETGQLGGEPSFNKNFFDSEGGSGGADSFNRDFFEGGGGGGESYDPMFGDALGGADPFRRIDDDEQRLRWRESQAEKKSPFLDRDERAEICCCPARTRQAISNF